MIPELGHFALVLAFVVALAQSSLPMLGAARGDRRLMAVAGPAALAQLLLLAVSFGALTYAFVVSDFSVALVVAHSHSAKPLLYKISGVWANHEGSLLLWVNMLALFGAAVALFGSNLPPALKARVLAVQGMIAVGFHAFMLFTSNPFLRVFPVPADGNDLNPILQDPGLAFHPPMLYLGYVGFSMAFSFAVAALIEGKVDAAWARWVRPWTLAAWVTLTLGIGLGARWAYYELGWGGWWFWDPVENASLMPWLAGTALLHSAIVVEKRDTLKSWTILLAILTFGLSLLGTFLVRSGVLTSVHTFASDPARGLFILGLFAAAVGGSLALYAVRAPALKGGGLFQPISREGALLLNNLLLATACATVFIGTLYPLFLDGIGGATVSVGPPYYNTTFMPLLAALVFVTGIGPMLAWKRGDLAAVLSRLTLAGVGAVAAALVAWRLETQGPILAVAGIGFAFWLLLATLIDLAGRFGLGRGRPAEIWRRAVGLPRSAWGGALAHAGLAVALLGMVGTTLWAAENIRVMRPGETTTLGGYDYRFDGTEQVSGPNYSSDFGRFTVSRGGAVVAVLTPEKRFYPVQGTPTTEAAIKTTAAADLYVVLGDPDGQGGWTVRVFHRPLAMWLWLGFVMMSAGGAVSLSDRRLRVGAPARRGLAAVAARPA
jgi:cytochrome c-type biogenesis protein CcmF